MLKFYLVCHWSVKKPLTGRKTAPVRPFSSICHWTVEAKQTRKLPKASPCPAPSPCLPMPPGYLRKVIFEHRVIAVDLSGSGSSLSAHTLCGMLVFLDHIRKATTSRHSALTTALQRAPNEYEQRGQGEAKLAEGRAEKRTCSWGRRAPACGCPTFPTGSPENPGRSRPPHPVLTAKTDEDDGARDPDPSPSLAVCCR